MIFFKKKFTYRFDEITIKDVPKVGGKNASLGEMYQKLTPQGIHVPNGFAVSAPAYFYFLKKTGLTRQLRKVLKDLNTKDLTGLDLKARQARELILGAELPYDLKNQIIGAYRHLQQQYYKNVSVAVRSSATAEDLAGASFAGQQETYLNVRGEQDLLTACRLCLASLFSSRAISYRVDKGFDHFKIGLSIGVQKMVRSDVGAAGVMFTLDTETGFRNVVLINGAWGLGENVVKGRVTPDEFCIFKGTLFTKHQPIIYKKLGQKEVKMVYATGREQTKNIKTKKSEREKYVLSDKEIIKLSEWAVLIEKHYGQPMDIEWAKDGKTKRLYIVQARPETVEATKKYLVLKDYILNKKGKVIVTGSPIGAKIGAGQARLISNPEEIKKFKPGEILVTDMTDPDWEPIMKMASGIVTNRGGRTCHAAIVSRELGIPCIVGTENGTKLIKNNQAITISCAEGEVGKIYEGILPFKIKKTNIRNIKRPKTKVMLNIGSPDIAFASSFIPNDGVGLAREEFIIADHIKIHPLALLNYHRLKDKKAKEKIAKLTAGYKDKSQYFVDKLAEGIAQIAAAFFPKDVIFRFSDFKTNEYASLIGGKQFEPKEENPMIGWRGASRYYSPAYKEAFKLECKALKKAREKIGLKNIKVMIPFCRTVEEGKKVIEVLKESGLKQGKDGLEVYVMAEIPSDIILAEQFAEVFDGFSIGSNDLTQLTLGVDRDSTLVSHIYDENNEAVKKLITQLIKTAKNKKRKVGICGQAPSDFPEFAKFLVKQGIDSISLNPDTVVKTTLEILAQEKKLKK
ncbi:MAG: phosphoenolpyruvate synthase [Candidatus Buchananbacteria bacterium]